MKVPRIPKIKREYKPNFAQREKRPLNRRLRFWLGVLVVVLILLVIHQVYLATSSALRSRPAQQVVVAAAHSEDVPVYLTGLGGVTPTYTVTVKTQINGQLSQVYFKEGQFVKAGDLLAQIDPRPYEAQLIQYQGQLARDQALLANAKLDLQRYAMLWRQNSVSKQIYDTQVSLVKQDQGTVELDQGLIATTKLNLVYCKIVSPVDGRIGLRLTDPGNYVQVSDTTGIAIIDTLNPITAVFTLPEDSIPEVLSQVDIGKTLSVEAFDRSQNTLLEKGTLLSMDNQVDPTTGTVKLKAQFSNQENKLFPNQFVNIKLLIRILKNATVIPVAAIQYGSQGKTFVYLLKDNKTVTAQQVKTGETNKDEITISSGLQPGQSVVVEGADKLTDGAKVIVASGNASGNTSQSPQNTKRRNTA